MKTRFKIIITCIIIISIIWFLWSPSFGQPECLDQIINGVAFIPNKDNDCRSWNNWDWIRHTIFDQLVL